MKTLNTLAILLLTTALGLAQQVEKTDKPLTITGSLDIRFDTRTKASPFDRYTLNVNVCDSAIFRGVVSIKPPVHNAYLADTLGTMNYDISWDIVNPRNPSQVATNVGKLSGSVPVSGDNVYQFAKGNLTMAVQSRGIAKGFESRFNGFALGKKPAASGFAKMKQQAVQLTKTNKGKTTTITVTDYDKMEFQNHVVASGPMQAYPEALVNGTLIYARSAWCFKDVTLTYALDGKQLIDRISGTIRWVEAPNRKTSGEGWYEFDVRFNEPPPGEGAMFAAAQDESAFFETDSSIAALTGTMRYKDAFSGDTTLASNVRIDLTGNRLNKQQMMIAAKWLLLSAIVPLNSD